MAVATSTAILIAGAATAATAVGTAIHASEEQKHARKKSAMLTRQATERADKLKMETKNAALLSRRKRLAGVQRNRTEFTGDSNLKNVTG